MRLFSILFLFVAPLANASENSASCKVLRYGPSGLESESNHSCKLFRDSEFGVSGECDFQAPGAIDVHVIYMNGQVDTLSANFKGIDFSSHSDDLTIRDAESGKEYLVLCGKAK